MTGMRDVAKKANVALSTVSIVLNNGDKYVSKELKERVLKAAKDLNYNIKKHKNDKYNAIAVILPNISSSFFSNLLNGVEEAAKEQGYITIVGNTHYDFEEEKRFLKVVKKQGVKGIVIDTVCPMKKEDEYYNFLKKNYIEKDISIIFLEKKIKREYEKFFHEIYIDHEKNAYLATLHLLEKGCKNIGHISGNLEDFLYNSRLKGYIRALKTHDISINKDLIVEGELTPSSGYIKAKDLMIKNNKIDAIFAANDQMAIGAIKAIQQEGKKIPEDILVVGIDNISVSSMIAPSLTTINVPIYQMGRKAIQILSKNDKKIYRIELFGNLIVRKSTDLDGEDEWILFGW